jgi:hypothetical protein
VDFSTSAVLASKVSSNESFTRRILLKFDTQNYIPANAIIQSATLYLVLKNAESSESRPFTAFHVTKSFVTRQTTWRTFRDGQWWSNGQAATSAPASARRWWPAAPARPTRST